MALADLRFKILSSIPRRFYKTLSILWKRQTHFSFILEIVFDESHSIRDATKIVLDFLDFASFLSTFKLLYSFLYEVMKD